MELPPELMRIPSSSLDVLRYMGRASVSASSAEGLAQGTGMSERGIGKAIRGLVTQGYLTMDASYVYFLTDKGSKAIQDIAAYDDSNPSDVGQVSSDSLIQQDLIVVTPGVLGAQETSTLQIGLNQLPYLKAEIDLVLRFSASEGNISPAEVNLHISPDQPPQPQETYYNPIGKTGMVRFRVEALQLTDMTEVHPAGGMFMDVQIAASSTGLQAWYGQIDLIVEA
jgi:hypothetical protein